MKMKKTKSLNLLKLGILFFGISLLLFSCEKDELISLEESNEIIPQKISLSQAKKDKDFMLVSQKFKLNNYLNENNHAKSTNNFTIDFSSFYKIKKANYTSYTFLLKRNNKDNSITENLVIEKRNDTVRGYIVKYSNIFYKKSGTDLFLNATTSRTYFKGDIEELLVQNNIEIHNKGGWSCSWNTTYTPRTCSVHGEFNEGNSDCGNYGKNNWTSSSYQTCSYNPTENTLSESSGHDLDFGSGGGGGGGSGSSETVPIINCGGDESFQNKTTASNCIEILEEEEDEQIINELTGKADCIYNDLVRSGINNHNLIRETFIEFGDGNFGNANLIYKQQSPLVNSNGVILNGASDKIGNDYIVILNSDRINNRAPIEIAKTIIHESLHALLKKHYYTGTESFIELFGKYMQENTGSNDITHAIMRDHYVSSISNTLKQFDNNQESEQFYDDLAWEGLHQFLPQSDIDRIIKTINQARNRGLNCN
jgi:hypothetical protein